jgi:hypothetical protein
MTTARLRVGDDDPARERTVRGQQREHAGECVRSGADDEHLRAGAERCCSADRRAGRGTEGTTGG